MYYYYLYDIVQEDGSHTPHACRWSSSKGDWPLTYFTVIIIMVMVSHHAARRPAAEIRL